MSLVVAVRLRGRVAVVADRWVHYGEDKRFHPDDCSVVKVFPLDGLGCVATVGDFAASDTLRRCASEFEYLSTNSPLKEVEDLAGRFSAACDARGWTPPGGDDGRWKNLPGPLLIAGQRGMYAVDSTCSATEHRRWLVMGLGEAEADGALAALFNLAQEEGGRSSLGVAVHVAERAHAAARSLYPGVGPGFVEFECECEE